MNRRVYAPSYANRVPSEGIVSSERYVSHLNTINTGTVTRGGLLSAHGIIGPDPRSSSGNRLQKGFYHEPIRTSFSRNGMQRNTHIIESNNVNGYTTEVRNLSTLEDDKNNFLTYKSSTNTNN